MENSGVDSGNVAAENARVGAIKAREFVDKIHNNTPQKSWFLPDKKKSENYWNCIIPVSGGKDSTYAIHLAKKLSHSVDVLLTLFPHSDESHLLHHPNIKLTTLQSESMGIPQLICHYFLSLN